MEEQTQKPKKEPKPPRMSNVKTQCFDLELVAPDKDSKKKLFAAVENSRQRYAGMIRHVFAQVATVLSASARPVEDEKKGFRLNLDWKRAEELMADVFGRTQQNKVREFLQELYPHWDSDIYDRIHRRVKTAISAKDPEMNAGRGFLTLQGARRLGWFANEPIPFRHDRDSQCKYLERGIILFWDKQLGRVEFRLKDAKYLEAGKWRIWRNIVSGAWKRGEGSLHCRDGRLFFKVTYERPAAKKAELDPEREMEVAFSADIEKYIACKLRKGHMPGEGNKPGLDELKSKSFSAVEIVHWLTKQKIADEMYARRQAACGKPGECKRGEGFGKQREYVGEKRKQHTAGRVNFCKTWNHVWTTRIARYAESELCGEVSLYLPKPPLVEDKYGKLKPAATANMFGHPWQFAEFAMMLTYKLKERGIKLTVYGATETEQAKPQDKATIVEQELQLAAV